MKKYLPVILILIFIAAGCAPKNQQPPAGTQTAPGGSKLAMADQLKNALSSGSPVVMEFYSDG